MTHHPLPPGTRILFANFPADGHFNPLTGLAVYLKETGCDVRWYTSSYYQPKISKLGIPFYSLKKAVDVSAAFGDADQLFPERKNIKGQVAKLKFDMVNAFILRGPEYFEDIQEIYQEFPFELMIADITFGGIPFVKERMNIPVISVGVMPLIETSKDLPPPGLGLTPSYHFFGRIKQNLLRYLSDKILFAEPTKVMWRTMEEHGINHERAGIFDIMIKKSDIVLQSGTPGFEFKRSDISRHIHFIGALLPYSKQKNTTTWYHEKLKKYSKVVLVTQGTVEKDIEKIIVPTLEAFRNTDHLVIVTTGGSQTRELRARYGDENFIIEDFIPFNDVMPYADVYVTNGGYGGVLLSISNRLPMVTAGVHEGKNEINARIGYFKLGINLRTEKPSPEKIRMAVSKVIHDPGYAANVAALAEEFRRFDPQQLCARHAGNLLKKRAVRKMAAQEEMSLIY